jgi:hypothetical protein
MLEKIAGIVLFICGLSLGCQTPEVVVPFGYSDAVQAQELMECDGTGGWEADASIRDLITKSVSESLVSAGYAVSAPPSSEAMNGPLAPCWLGSGIGVCLRKMCARRSGDFLAHVIVLSGVKPEYRAVVSIRRETGKAAAHITGTF